MGARSIFAGILLVLSVLVAPVAAVGAWARAEILDTDNFVATMDPLIEEPEVRELLRDETLAAIQQQIDIESLPGDGLEELLSDGIDQAIASDAFADVWTTMLQQAHMRTVDLFEQDPDSAASLAEDGTLALELGVVVEQIKQALVDQGLAFAADLPEVTGSVTIVTDDSLNTARTAYNLTDSFGFWLPFIAGALLLIGLALSVARFASLARTAGAYVFMFLTVLAAVVLGEEVLSRSMTPDSMSPEAASTIYGQVFASLRTLLIVLSISAAVVCIAGAITSTILSRRAQRPRPYQPDAASAGPHPVAAPSAPGISAPTTPAGGANTSGPTTPPTSSPSGPQYPPTSPYGR